MINEYRRFHMKFTRNYFLRFLAILFISASFSGCGKKPKQTADHFMSLLVAGKHLEVQEMLGKDMKSMAGMLGGVSNESLKPYFRAGTFKSYALTEQEKTDKSVRYRVDAITSEDCSVTEETLDRHVMTLRDKLGLFSDYVQTVPYIGYRFKE